MGFELTEATDWTLISSTQFVFHWRGRDIADGRQLDWGRIAILRCDSGIRFLLRLSFETDQTLFRPEKKWDVCSESDV